MAIGTKRGKWIIKDGELYNEAGEFIADFYPTCNKDKSNLKLASKAPEMIVMLRKVLEKWGSKHKDTPLYEECKLLIKDTSKY